MLDFTFLFNIQTERATVQLASFEQVLNLINIKIIETKDWLDWDHNMSHLTLYPDVLEIKTIIDVKQKFAKIPFVYYLQIHFWLLFGLDFLVAG